MKTICRICLLVLLLVSIAVEAVETYHEMHTHEIAAIVDEVTADCVVLVDSDGEAWVFEGDGYEVGQFVIVVFDDCGTAEIYDDEIIEIRG